MNRSNQLLPFLAASLSLLTLPALAQSSGSPGSGSSQPSTARSDRDQRPGPPESTRPGSGASTSGSSADSSRTRASDLDSRTQVNARGSILFDQLDTDRDGRISQAEYTRSSFQGGVSGKGPVSAQGNAGGATARSGTSTGVGGAASGGQTSAETFRQLDTNRDGYLSQDELYEGQSNRIRGSVQQKP